jgi:hypothetical protein
VPGSIAERKTFRSELVSFAVDGAALEAAREHVRALNAEAEAEANGRRRSRSVGA